MSMDRMVEERAAKDDAFRRIVEQNGRPLLSHGRAMSDDALTTKLRALGLDAHRERFVDLFRRSMSAEAVARAMIASARPRIPEREEDWVWIALTCLWERWLPEVPSTEMVDDKMQAGYVALKECDCPKACGFWLETWRAILDIMERCGIDSLRAFDDHFGGTQSVFNWVQDLETELHNAGLEEPQFFRERIALCETMIARFSDGHPPIANFKTGLAQSHFELGEREAGDRLFRRWLDERPQWSSGWIAWSDCYWTFAAEGNKDAAKAEKLLKEGLAAPGIEDPRFMLERLAGIYDETGRTEEAETVRAQIKRLPSPQETASSTRTAVSQVPQDADSRSQELPVGRSLDWEKSPLAANRAPTDPLSRAARVGRNEPCPCGSGKKYKKCCGKRA
jgi:hypothetical protein